MLKFGVEGIDDPGVKAGVAGSKLSNWIDLGRLCEGREVSTGAGTLRVRDTFGSGISEFDGSLSAIVVCW